MGLSELKSRDQQGCAPFYRFHSLPFPTAGSDPHYLVCGCLPQSSKPAMSRSSYCPPVSFPYHISEIFFSFKDLYDCIEPPLE